MMKVTLKGLGMHKARAVLTTLAVVIGVAMISGAYVVSDTMLSAATSLSGAALCPRSIASARYDSFVVITTSAIPKASRSAARSAAYGGPRRP